MDSVPFGLGFSEILFIALAALVLLGPKRLPELGRAAGKLAAQLRRSGLELRRAFEEEVGKAEREAGDLVRLKDDLSRAGRDIGEAGKSLLASTGWPRPAGTVAAQPAPPARPAETVPPPPDEDPNG